MVEYLRDHCRLFDGSDDLHGATTVGTVFDVDIEYQCRNMPAPKRLQSAARLQPRQLCSTYLLLKLIQKPLHTLFLYYLAEALSIITH